MRAYHPNPSAIRRHPMNLSIGPQGKKELILLTVSLAAAVVDAFGSTWIRLPLI